MNKNSETRSLYLKKVKRNNIFVKTSRILILLGIIALWEILARLEVIDAFIMSSPSRILTTTIGLFKQDLFHHIGITLYETVLGFIVSTIIGTLVAIILWSNKTINKIFEPYLVVLNSLPKVALGPIIIIWFGAGMKAIVVMTVLICVIVTTINILNAFTSVDQDKMMLLKSMGASTSTCFCKLVFPSSLPTIISTLKINVGLAFVGAIMGEYLVSRAGLGYLIVYGSQVFKLDLVMASTIILLILAGIIYAAVAQAEKLVIRYK